MHCSGNRWIQLKILYFWNIWFEILMETVKSKTFIWTRCFSCSSVHSTLHYIKQIICAVDCNEKLLTIKNCLLCQNTSNITIITVLNCQHIITKAVDHSFSLGKPKPIIWDVISKSILLYTSISILLCWNILMHSIYWLKSQF